MGKSSPNVESTSNAERTEPRWVAPPKSQEELLSRVQTISGKTLGELAQTMGMPLPPSMLRGKGFAGALLERCLGADAASRAEPDFRELGIELKSIPVRRNGSPLESTFVCTIDLNDIAEVEFSASRMAKKMSKVLWIPILAEREIPIAERIVGQGFFWRASEEQLSILKQDWEELAGRIGMGQIDSIDARLGTALQIRPKAAKSASRRLMVGPNGIRSRQMPRGFYLRASFTAMILRSAYET